MFEIVLAIVIAWLIILAIPAIVENFMSIVAWFVGIVSFLILCIVQN